ncbi:MAG TPA: TlpA disulfide reductase family protein [Burkholderiaceae bacterium]|nr:TlpA disulfide reductase family protein [Burkholderiaceae bacterium]
MAATDFGRRAVLGRGAACAAGFGLLQAGRGAFAQASGSAPAMKPAVPEIGSRIALPEVTLLDGRVLPPSHWDGKLLVVELWASWCPFCARQNPHLDALHRAHSNRGLEVLGLSIDRDSDAARRYMADNGYVFHAAMDDERWRAALGRPRGLPIVWVVDRQSRLAKLEIGEMFPEDIAEIALLLDDAKR